MSVVVFSGSLKSTRWLLGRKWRMISHVALLIFSRKCHSPSLQRQLWHEGRNPRTQRLFIPRSSCSQPSSQPSQMSGSGHTQCMCSPCGLERGYVVGGQLKSRAAAASEAASAAMPMDKSVTTSSGAQVRRHAHRAMASQDQAEQHQQAARMKLLSQE